MGAVCPWAATVGVEDNLGRGHDYGDEAGVGVEVDGMSRSTGTGTGSEVGVAIIYVVFERGWIMD